MLNLNNYICALDIGSSKIAAAVAEIKKGRINNVFFESSQTKGIKRGVIVDSVALINSVGKLLNNLKAKSGINIKFISTNISGQDIITKHSRAIIPLAERGNKVITLSDIQKVNEQARILGSSLDEEILHLIPAGYAIDAKSSIVNPLGLYSHRLEVDLYLVCAKLSSVQSLSRAISKSGYEIRNLFFSGVATSKAVFDNELNDGVNLFCDLGADTMEILIFRDGNLCDIEILPFGGDDLTRELEDSLKVPFDLAEDIKRSYGIIGDPGQIGEDKEILVKRSHFYNPIKQRMVSEVLTLKAKSICLIIKETIEKKMPLHGINNFVIVGKTMLLEGFIETLESILRIPIKLGKAANLQIPSPIKEGSELSGQKYLTYLTALGMVCEDLKDKSSGIFLVQRPAKNLILKAINRFKEVYQEYF